MLSFEAVACARQYLCILADLRVALHHLVRALSSVSILLTTLSLMDDIKGSGGLLRRMHCGSTIDGKCVIGYEMELCIILRQQERRKRVDVPVSQTRNGRQCNVAMTAKARCEAQGVRTMLVSIRVRDHAQESRLALYT